MKLWLTFLQHEFQCSRGLDEFWNSPVTQQDVSISSGPLTTTTERVMKNAGVLQSTYLLFPKKMFFPCISLGRAAANQVPSPGQQFLFRVPVYCTWSVFSSLHVLVPLLGTSPEPIAWCSCFRSLKFSFALSWGLRLRCASIFSPLIL